MKKNKNSSLVKDSTKLREALLKRWKEIFGKTYTKGVGEHLQLTVRIHGIKTAVAEDALKHGRPDITRSGISRYINDPYSQGALNESQILWLATRWQVPVQLVVGNPDQDVKYYIPKPYDEELALKNLNEKYGKKDRSTDDPQGTKA